MLFTLYADAVQNLDKFLQGQGAGLNVSEALEDAETILQEIKDRKFSIDKYNVENELE